jgi:hypothetical protein
MEESQLKSLGGDDLWVRSDHSELENMLGRDGKYLAQPTHSRRRVCCSQEIPSCRRGIGDRVERQALGNEVAISR